MSQLRAEQRLEQEEAAQGQGIHDAPGQELLLEQAKDEAHTPDWISDETIRWPSEDAASDVVNRRRELYDAMRRLEAVTARPSGLADWRIEIEGALSNLDSALDDHVRDVESETGVFDDVRDRAPHLVPAIKTLKGDHVDLKNACHTALSMAADWSSETLRRRVNMLLARLAIHRQQGAELLYEAYNVDLAAGD